MEVNREQRLTGNHFLLFRLDLHKFAVPFGHVVRVVSAKKTTPVPAVPEYIEGIIHSDGRFIPQVRMKQLLGLQDLGLGEPIHAMIVRDSKDSKHFSFLMDSKGDIVQMEEVDKDRRQEDNDKDFYSGQFIHQDEIVFILDIDRLMSTYRVDRDGS